MINESIITSSAVETEKLGEHFATRLKAGDVVCLIGQLGAGKTTFVKGVAAGLGIKTRIISPTYVVVREHEITSEIRAQKSDIRTLYHLDLYRLTSEKDVLGVDIHDLIADKNAVTMIEWPEIASEMLPRSAWKITLDNESETSRKILIQKTSS